MKNSIHAIIFAFKEVFSWHTMKYTLLSGIVVIGLWSMVGVMFWEHLMAMSSSIIDMVPFSMVRSNGAWMLSTFLWLQVVLLTFALILAFLGNFILRHTEKEKYSTFSMYVFLGSALFWGVVWYLKGDIIYAKFLTLLTWLPFETVEKGIAFLIGFYLLYNAVVVTMIFITSFFSEPLLISIEKRHFDGEEVRRDHLFRSLGYTIKDAFIFLFASLIAFPLLFVPVVNLLVQIALWMWLIKDTMGYDAHSLTYEKVDKTVIKEHRVSVWFISFITALFNFVPILNLFGPTFGEVALFHYFKSLQKNS